MTPEQTALLERRRKLLQFWPVTGLGLPVVVLTLFAVVAVMIAFLHVALSNERKYLAIIDGDANSPGSTP
jgi:hypothetical protein